MTDSKLYGHEAPRVNPLGDAIERHSKTLLKLNQLPNGMIAIDAGALFCDSQLLHARVELLFESLVERGLLDPKEMVEKLTRQLNAESDEMQRQIDDAPQIEIATGSVPRNG